MYHTVLSDRAAPITILLLYINIIRYRTDHVTVLKPDGDGLALDGRGLLVAHLVDHAAEVFAERRLLPVAHRVRNFAA